MAVSLRLKQKKNTPLRRSRAAHGPAEGSVAVWRELYRGLDPGSPTGDLFCRQGGGLRRGVQALLSDCQHQLDAVFLVDPGGAGVVIDGGDIGAGIQGTDLVHHALAHDMVGQATEGWAQTMLP